MQKFNSALVQLILAELQWGGANPEMLISLIRL